MAIEWFWGGEGNSYREFDTATNVQMAAAQTGMSGSYCLYTTNSSTPIWAKNVTARADYYMGFRFRCTNALANKIIVSFFDGATQHFTLVLTSTGYLRGCLGTSSTSIVDSATPVISLNTTYRIEVYMLIADSNGRFVVKVDGGTVIDYTGDTRNAGTAQITIIKAFTGFTTYYPNYLYYDDMVIRTDTYPGDVRVGGKLVTANGTTNDWDPSAGDNYACVNDADDADYVYTNTANEVELYALDNLTEAINAIQAVKIAASARYQGASSVTNLQLAMRSGETNYFSANKALLTAFGVDLFNIWEADPADDAAWTEAKVNALEVGFKAIA